MALRHWTERHSSLPNRAQIPHIVRLLIYLKVDNLLNKDMNIISNS